MYDKFFDEYQIGETWTSRARTITETDVVNFSGVSGDFYPLHTDKEWAASTAFGQRIAHGMLLLSVATGLLMLRPGVVVAFYGMDRVRFVSPVFIGDTIHLQMEVTGKEDKGIKGGVITSQMEIINQRGETVVSTTIKMLVNGQS
jgi:3-hydroxybutyryl-CoA dehydratase